MNKGLRKIIAGALILASMMAINPVGANAAWREDNSGWWYTEGSSWATGWRLIDGKWYYFRPSDGYMAESTTINGHHVGRDGSWVDDSNFNVGAAKAEQLVKNKYYPYTAPYIETRSFDGTEWTIQAYYSDQYMTYTTGWYYVNKNTGVIRSMY